MFKENADKVDRATFKESRAQFGHTNRTDLSVPKTKYLPDKP